MYINDLKGIIFNRHLSNGADELLIVTGYISSIPFKELKDLPINCKVIYGMYGTERISEQLHAVLKDIQSSAENLELFYSKGDVHAKCYIWKKEGKVVDAIVGSANFSQKGLATNMREVVVTTDESDYEGLNDYFNDILNNSLSCDSDEVRIKTEQEEKFIAAEQLIKCNLSFLDRTLEVPKSSGLNWGANSTQVGGTAHTCIGDAEIRIRKPNAIDFPTLFPPKLGISRNRNQSGRLHRQNDEVELIWDDGRTMKGSFEQNMEIDGMLYPKAICSSDTKAELGLYLRDRLKVTPTEIITKETLEAYGRTDVTISLQGEGVYYMDFSVKKDANE